jgi:rod shape-determining protein MreD
MRSVRYLAVLLALVLLEGSLPVVLRPFGAGPDLLLCFALTLALHADSWRVFGWLWGIGLARDLFSLDPFGFHALLFGAGGMAVWLARETIFRHHVLTRIASAGVLSLLVGLVSLLRIVAAGGTPDGFSALGRLLVTALLTAALAPVLAHLLLRSRMLVGLVPVREMGEAA